MKTIPPEWYLLRNALMAEDYRAAETLLDEHPDLIAARNGIGETVAHDLALENALPGLKWLHSRGADLDVTNDFGTPVLFEVAQLGHQVVFLWLVEQGADLVQRDGEGRTLHAYLEEFQSAAMQELLRQVSPGRPLQRDDPIRIRQVPDHRQRTVAMLEMLACEEEQSAYERDQPHVDVAVEEICRWFENAWRPGDPAYNRCFTAGELRALAAFAEVLQQKRRDLPESIHMLRPWLAQPSGRDLMARAREVIQLLQPAPARRGNPPVREASSYEESPSAFRPEERGTRPHRSVQHRSGS